MNDVRVSFTESELAFLRVEKGELSWRDFILRLAREHALQNAGALTKTKELPAA